MATMATLGLRQVLRASQVVASRGFATSAVAKKEYGTPDAFEHATGIEKWELAAKKAGNNDPFFMNMRVRGKGTKEDPNIVDSMDSYKMVGCCCQEDDTCVKYMWVQEGVPKRCQCGYWFSLKKHAAPEKFKLPI